MVIRLLSIYFILNLLKVQGQTIDSLRSAAAQLRHDSDKVALYYHEGLGYRIVNPQYSYDCAIEAENMANRGSTPLYIAKASDLLGFLYHRKGDYTNALVYHKKALALRMLLGDKAGIAVSQTNIGDVYWGMKLHQQAEAAYLDAVADFYETGQLQQTGYCLLRLGNLNSELKNTNAAENYLNAAITNAKARSDHALEAAALNKLAALNIANKNYDTAIANALSAVRLNLLPRNNREMADSYLNLSEAYFQKEEFARGRAYLKTADSIIAEAGYTEARLQSLMKHAAYEEQTKNFEIAYNNLKSHGILKDSLDQVNALAKTQNSFIERKIVEAPLETHEKPFPYLLLLSLCAMALACVLFLLRFRK